MPDELDPDALYHLATPDEWAAHGDAGRIAPPSLESEGFVHCSWGRQVAGTVAKHFGAADVVLALAIEPTALDAELVEEDSYGSGQAFPHVYGPLPLASVRSVATVKP
jgi:uncharacterized protein (DUF952 family)